jgi:hypothetical protein
LVVTSTGKIPLHFVDPGVKIERIYYRTHILENTLLRDLVAAWDEIDPVLRRIFANFVDRLKAVVQAKGDYIEM